jgi:hypothetical protein
MNQKPNSITLDLNIHFERSLEVRSLIKWIVPIAIALVRFAIHLHGGS